MRIFSGLSHFSFLGVFLVLAALGGCASTDNYGNFIKDEPSAAQNQLAKDSAKQLEKLYSPAKTHLVLQHETPDAFGKALVASLREAGFAVQTFDKHQSKPKPTPHTAQRLLPVNPNEPVQLELAYILDQAGEAGLYHLTLFLNQQSLTRLYRLDDNRFIAAGDWVRKQE